MKHIYNGLPAFAFIIAIALCTAFLLIAGPSKTRSEAERRPLAEAPEFTAQNVLDGRYFDKLETWLADHFPAREEFRHLRVVYQTKIINENEYNGFVNYRGSIVRLQKTINENSLEHAAERFEYVRGKYLENAANIYAALVPDKSFFLAEAGFKVLDFDEFELLYAKALPFAKNISLKEVLTLEDYYQTDTHWRQECLSDAAKHLLSALGRDTGAIDTDFEKTPVYPFYGVYTGHSAMKPAPETLYYLTGGYLDDCKVINLEDRTVIPMYDPENCDKRDLYTLFLGGSKAIVRIENPAKTGTLILFRDSFGSAIAPLLAADYGTVYLLDIRYAHPDVLGRYLNFDGADVLFLYSESLMNDSQGIK